MDDYSSVPHCFHFSQQRQSVSILSGQIKVRTYILPNNSIILSATLSESCIQAFHWIYRKNVTFSVHEYINIWANRKHHYLYIQMFLYVTYYNEFSCSLILSLGMK